MNWGTFYVMSNRLNIYPTTCSVKQLYCRDHHVTSIVFRCSSQTTCNTSVVSLQVKHLTRDWRTTAYALRHSKMLELNEEGRKVRRKSAVPVFASESLPSRMLLVSDLQKWPELASLTKDNGVSEGAATQQEQLMKLLLKEFGTYGAIASVRVLKPGKELPADLKRLSGRYTQLAAEECAIVEFEEVEAAVKANEAVGCEDGGTGSLGFVAFSII